MSLGGSGGSGDDIMLTFESDMRVELRASYDGDDGGDEEEVEQRGGRLK